MISRLSLRRRGAVVAGVVLAGGLVAGGATAFADSSGATAAPTASASSAPSAPSTAKKAHHHRLRRFLLGVHGQATVKNARTGRFVVREWQRGVITAVAGDSVTVRSVDGTSWTWTVAKNATVTRDGKKIAESVLKDGDTVEVVGLQNGGANDATRIFAPSAAQIAKLKAKAAQHRANG